MDKFLYNIEIQRTAQIDNGSDRKIIGGAMEFCFDGDSLCQSESGELTDFGAKALVSILAGTICEVSKSGAYPEHKVIQDAINMLEHSISSNEHYIAT